MATTTAQMDPALQALSAVALLPQSLLDAVAIGTESLPGIFETHGYSVELAEKYRDDPQFKRVVALRQRELAESGILHAARAGAVADRTLQTLAIRISDPNTPLSVVLDSYKALAKNAGYEPKANSTEAAGAGFSIVINLPGGAQTTASTEKPVETPQGALENDITDVVEIPEKTAKVDINSLPNYLKQVNFELSAGVEP